MNGHGDRIAAREKVVRCALAVVTVERTLAEDAAAVTKLAKAETDLELACRDLTNVIDDLPPMERPKGWGTEPGDETA